MLEDINRFYLGQDYAFTNSDEIAANVFRIRREILFCDHIASPNSVSKEAWQ